MHPNIVNVYDVGEENGIYYIVMELVEGITLKKYIEKKARLFMAFCFIYIRHAAGADLLQHLVPVAYHHSNLNHIRSPIYARNASLPFNHIKPQNIIISKDGKVKVTDFGIAKAATSNTITSNHLGVVVIVVLVHRLLLILIYGFRLCPHECHCHRQPGQGENPRA